VSGALRCLIDVPGIAVASGATTDYLPGLNDVLLANHCFCDALTLQLPDFPAVI
jgi:hypothetical protein